MVLTCVTVGVLPYAAVDTNSGGKVSGVLREYNVLGGVCGEYGLLYGLNIVRLLVFSPFALGELFCVTIVPLLLAFVQSSRRFWIKLRICRSFWVRASTSREIGMCWCVCEIDGVFGVVRVCWAVDGVAR